MKRKSKSDPLCACMICRREWFRMDPLPAKRLATAVFGDLRKCPYCKLRGQKAWGELTQVDREAREGIQAPRLTKTRKILSAFKIATGVFFDVLNFAEESES